jgi:hypothetical protein
MNISTPKLQTWGVPVILGIPLDHNSSYLRGPAQAPPLIREAQTQTPAIIGRKLKSDLGLLVLSKMLAICRIGKRPMRTSALKRP